MDRTTEPDGMFTEGSNFYLCFKTCVRYLFFSRHRFIFALALNVIECPERGATAKAAAFSFYLLPATKFPPPACVYPEKELTLQYQ